MANIAKLIRELSKRAKVDSEITEAIAGVIDSSELESIEITEDAYTAILGGLYDLDSAESKIKPKLQKTLKAEALNGVDAGILQGLESELTDDEAAELKATEGTKNKIEFATRVIKSRKPQSSRDSETRILNLTRALEDAKAETRAKDSEKATAISDLEAKHKSELFKISLESKILGRTDIAKEQKEGRHFMSNFISDFNGYLKGEDIKINADDNSVLKNDDTPYFTKTNETVGVDDLLTLVIDKYKYKKNSETPKVKEVEVTGGGEVKEKSLNDIYSS